MRCSAHDSLGAGDKLLSVNVTASTREGALCFERQGVPYENAVNRCVVVYMDQNQDKARQELELKFKRLIESLNKPGAMDKILRAAPKHGQVYKLGPPR